MHDTFAGPDALTQVLLALRLDGVEYSRCGLRAPWAVAFPAQPTARFHLAAQGDCWLQVRGGPWIPLKQGDAVLLPRGVPHVLASAIDATAIGVDTLARTPVSDVIYLMGELTDPAASSHTLFCAGLRFNLDERHPLLAVMPEAILASELAERDPTVPMLLEAMEREVAGGRAGACGIVARMADLLSAATLRAWAECACAESSQLVAALRCPVAGRALAAIHADPVRDWTNAELAGLTVLRSRCSMRLSRKPWARRRRATSPAIACCWPRNGSAFAACT